SVAMSPDGRRLITASNSVLTNCKDPVRIATCEEIKPDHSVRIWDISSGAAITSLTGSDDAWRAVFSPDGRLVAWEDNKGIKIADAATGRVIRAIDGAKKLRSFSANSQLLLDASHIWNAATGRATKTFAENCIPAAAFSPDARRIVTHTLSEDQKV